MAASAPPKLFGTTVDQLTSRTVFRWTRKQTTAFVDFGQLHGFEKKAEIAAADLQPLFDALGLAYLNGERNHLDQDIARDVLRPKVIDKMARLMKEGHWKAKDEQVTTVQVKEEGSVAGYIRASTFDHPTGTCIIPDSDTQTKVAAPFTPNRKVKDEPTFGAGGIIGGSGRHSKNIKAPLVTQKVFISDSEDTEPDVVAKTKKVTNRDSHVADNTTDAMQRRSRGVKSLATRKVFISDSDSEDTDRDDTAFDALAKAFSASNVSEISPSQSEVIDYHYQSNYDQPGPNQRNAAVQPVNMPPTPSKSPSIFKPSVKVPSGSIRPGVSSNFSTHQSRPGNPDALSQIASLKDITLELWHRLMKLEETVNQTGGDSSEFIL